MNKHLRMTVLLVTGILCAAGSAFTPLTGAQSAASADDSRILNEAKGHLQSGYLLRAKEAARKIADRPGAIGEEARNMIQLIGTIEKNDSHRQDAFIAISRNQNNVACDHLQQIEASLPSLPEVYRRRYLDVSKLKERAGGCSPAVPEISNALKQEFEKARTLSTGGDLKGAQQMLEGILAQNPGYEAARSLLDQVKDALEKQPAPPPAAVPSKIPQEAKKSLPAAESAPKVSELRVPPAKPAEAVRVTQEEPPQKPLTEPSNVAAKNETDALLQCIRPFYAGQYGQAQRLLTDFVTERHPPESLAFAHFFLGAALASEFFLSGESDTKRKEEALQQFGNALKAYRDFSPQPALVSSKIMNLYLEAAKREKL